LKRLQEQHFPDDIVGLVIYPFTTVQDGPNAYPADDVERALGRMPQDFRNYARDVAVTGVWAP
jgi:hypothetical protein